MKILTAAEMREVDRLTVEQRGVPSLKLMENAGRSVAGLIEKVIHGRARKSIVLCGRGNNGGDGFVAARYLRQSGGNPELLLFGEPGQLRGDAATNYQRLAEAGAQIRVIRDAKGWSEAKPGLARAEIILDALLGTGARGAAEGLLAEAIEAINQLRDARRGPWPLVIAVDIPSGLDADTGETTGPVVRADYTVTFAAPKIGMVLGDASRAVGRLQVARIGSPASLIEETGKSGLRWLDAAEVADFAAPRAASGHKGDYGHALIIAGSVGKTGAAVLASWAALRAGAGLVTLAIPEPALAVAAARIPEVMTAPVQSTREGTISLRALGGRQWRKILEGKRAIGMGPGLGQNPETQRAIRKIVSERQLPMVLDADGLNAFGRRGDELSGKRAAPQKRKRTDAPLAITPHPGEMSRLIGRDTNWIQANRIECARRAAAKWSVWMILKGHQTVIAAPGDRNQSGGVWINSTGNPGMGTAGAGDVLTGMLAGLAAQHASRDWEGALKFGVYLHGLAGDKAAEEKSEASLMASDVIEAIPRAYREFLSKSRELCGEKL